MTNLIVIMCFGVIIGSFLNVCIYRIPAKQSIVTPRSHCMTCGHVLGSLELIPIISYLCLKGRCKSCKTKISPRYMCIELLTGICFGFVYMQYGISLETLLYCSFVIFGITLTMIDWDHMLLPTSIIRVGALAALIFKVLQSTLQGDWQILVQALLGGVVGYFLLYVVFYGSKWLLKKEGLGFGDVRLVGMIGLYLGLEHLFTAIIIACVLAAVYGIVLLMVKKKSEPFPLGPFLNGGAFITILWGRQLILWYFNLLGL